MADCTYVNSGFVHNTGVTATATGVVVGSGESLVLWVVHLGSTNIALTAATWNGTENFVQVGTSRYWLLKNPTAGTHNVSITLASDPAGDVALMWMVVDNLDQVNSTRSVTSGTTPPPSEIGDLVVGAMSCNFGDTNAWIANANATERINHQTDTTGSGCIDFLLETRAGLAGTTPMDFQHTVTDYNATSKREFVALIGATEGGQTPTQMAKNTGDNQTATVNTAVAVAPTVLVRDANNNPVADVSVVFAVASGGGSLGGSGSVTTNQNGIATCPAWTLGTTAGQNTLTATHAGLAGNPLTFTATGTAGAATDMSLYAGNNQTAPINTALAVQPAVLVQDTYDNPKSGVTVNWTVVTGGGTVTNGSSQTNASGVASIGWTMGGSPGSASMTGAVSGLTGSPVTFSATATVTQTAFQYRRRR